MCRCLGVSTSGYYEWRERGPSKRAQQDKALVEILTVTHDCHKQRYGSRRHVAELRAVSDTNVGRNRISRLMREHGLRARMGRPYVVTTNSNHESPIAPNELDRNFHPGGPNQAWVGDLTYIPTRDGWLYLAVVIDLFSRRVVGWAMATRPTRQVVLDAMFMALRRRRPQPGLLIFHSDRGSQYASDDFRRLINKHGVTQSMSRRANCWDNAVAESFFATLEKELLVDQLGRSRDEVGQAIFLYIEGYYNRQRRHSTLGYQSPCEFEAEATRLSLARTKAAKNAA
jgi:transposase InsO family protein